MFWLSDRFCYILFVPDFGITFSEFASLGEMLIIFWHLIKGVKVEEWKKRALEFS